jgi:hypothetical protein
LNGTPGNVEVKEDLADCPRCGGGGGFHVSFRRKGRAIAVILVCPSCGFRFTVGAWEVPSGEPRPYDPAIDSGP